MCFGVAPGHGEGVRGPEADGGHGDEHVLAGPECPGAGQFQGHAEGVAWEGFHDGFRASSANVSVNERRCPNRPLNAVSTWG